MQVYLPISIAQSNETKFCCRINNEVFRHPANMGHRERRPHQELHDKVPVSNPPQAVFGDRVEPELFCQEFSINNKRVAR